jgi:hypothetical protein
MRIGEHLAHGIQCSAERGAKMLQGTSAVSHNVIA